MPARSRHCKREPLCNMPLGKPGRRRASYELEPGYLLILVIRHYPRAMGRNNAWFYLLVKAVTSASNVRRFLIFKLRPGR
jgi:hypothetical protein